MKSTVILRGGLGNQMFQYAITMALRAKGYKVVLDTTMYSITQMHNGYELERVFGIKEPVCSTNFIHTCWIRLIARTHPSNLVTSDKLEYSRTIFDAPKLYIDGYWQDERYFLDIREQVQERFSFKNVDDKNYGYAQEMQSRDSISLHVRRGDYALCGMSMMSENYYRSAVAYLNSKISAPYYYLFSDDIANAESMAKNMGIDYTVISHNNGQESYKDMFLMSQCKHNIIANSSFSWWGAWLNKNERKMVVAPKVWEVKVDKLRPQAYGWVLI